MALQQQENLILVVDDQRSTRDYLGTLLKEEGYRVVEAENGQEAVDLFDQEHPDLIFMDINMPVMDGYEATRQIKSRVSARHVPIIFLTAENNENALIHSLESGGDDFLSKPFSLSLIRAKVKAQLRIQTLNDSLQTNIQRLEQEVEDHKRTQQELHHISNYDALTSFPNRHFFLIYLAQSIQVAEAYGRKMALLLMDITNFKLINDSYGHVVGDEVLREVADRLREETGETFLIARLGGDDFALLCEDIQTEEQVEERVGAIIAKMAEPFHLEGKELLLGVTMGTSLYPNDCRTPESMLRCADTALEYARSTGNNNYRSYEPEMKRQTRESVELQSSIHKALEKDEYELYYQPQVDSMNHSVVGAEALLRWNHPELGSVPPDRFVPILEKEGLIVEVGTWVMREAIRQHLDWIGKGYPPVRVAINFSVLQLQEEGMAEMVINEVRESGIAPPWFKLEITETATVSNFDQVKSTLYKIRNQGIQIAVDDFGTGYSTLSYLQKLPVDIIKIDRQFIRDIPFSSDDKTLVKAVIGMAHSLSLDVVAEGIETEEQAAFLKQHRCDELQGYLFGKPLPAEEFEVLLTRHKAEIEEELTLF